MATATAIRRRTSERFVLGIPVDEALRRRAGLSFREIEQGMAKMYGKQNAPSASWLKKLRYKQEKAGDKMAARIMEYLDPCPCCGLARRALEIED